MYSANYLLAFKKSKGKRVKNRRKTDRTPKLYALIFGDSSDTQPAGSRNDHTRNRFAAGCVDSDRHSGHPESLYGATHFVPERTSIPAAPTGICKAERRRPLER